MVLSNINYLKVPRVLGMVSLAVAMRVICSGSQEVAVALFVCSAAVCLRGGAQIPGRTFTTSKIGIHFNFVPRYHPAHQELRLAPEGTSWNKPERVELEVSMGTVTKLTPLTCGSGSHTSMCISSTSSLAQTV